MSSRQVGSLPGKDSSSSFAIAIGGCAVNAAAEDIFIADVDDDPNRRSKRLGAPGIDETLVREIRRRPRCLCESIDDHAQFPFTSSRLHVVAPVPWGMPC